MSKEGKKIKNKKEKKEKKDKKEKKKKSKAQRIADADKATNKELREKAAKAKRTDEERRNAIRRMVRMFYDLQRLRIAAGQRGAKKKDAGPDLEVEDWETFDEKNIKAVPKEVPEVQLNKADIAILDRRHDELLTLEENMLGDIEAALEQIPVWTQILKPIKGIGPTLGGVLISEIDIHRSVTCSALWRYCGLSVVTCHRCKTCNDVVRFDKNADGYTHLFARKIKPCKRQKDTLKKTDIFESKRSEHPVKKEKLHYNKFLKTKLLGVMAGNLMRAGSPCREKYFDGYKHRLESANRGRDAGHRNRMALRYMVKMLLQEIWREWRALEGLEVRPPYQEQYLGHVHHE